MKEGGWCSFHTFVGWVQHGVVCPPSEHTEPVSNEPVTTARASLLTPWFLGARLTHDTVVVSALCDSLCVS